MAKLNLQDVLAHPLLEDGEVNEAFADFLAMRKKMRRPATDRAIKLLLKTLIELSMGKPQVAVKIIDRSITNCWLDFYQLKEEDTVQFETPSQRADRLKREDKGV